MDEGVTKCSLHDSVLNYSEAYESVLDDGAGGISVFAGTTRNTFEDKTVVQLEYECYRPMAEKEMYKLCEKMRSQWKVKHIYVAHRLGIVPVKEASVIIAVSSAHRREAIDACSFAIDELKAKVPIWKKEIYEDGSTWKENKEFEAPTK